MGMRPLVHKLTTLCTFNIYLSTSICIHVIEGGFRHKQSGRLTKITEGERLSLFHILLALINGMLYPVKPKKNSPNFKPRLRLQKYLYIKSFNDRTSNNSQNAF